MPPDVADHHHADPDAVLAAAWEPDAETGPLLETALAGAGVAALTLDPATGSVDLLLHAPVAGSRDARCILRLVASTRVVVRLAPSPAPTASGDGAVPALPFGGLPDVAALMSRLSWAGACAGTRFLDVDPPARAGAAVVEVALAAEPGAHRWWWFAECLLEEGDGEDWWLLDGTVDFGGCVLLDARGAPLDLATFAARRLARDPRALTRGWRHWWTGEAP
ncbi:MAG: hypothetical protein U0Q15_13865 [Kineosporiaceae bacterium]